MRDSTAPKPAKLPFFLADLVLLGAAYFVYMQSEKPLNTAALGLMVACVAAAAFFGVFPFILEFRALLKLAESESLQSVVGQVNKLDTIATQISGATARWQGVQESATSTAANARSIAETMAAEVKGFTKFMEKAQESERATLQLEVQKLRRAEADWLQVLIHFLDHTYALHKAAARSTHRGVADQVSAFQNACRDIARRVGLTPFTADPSEPFNAERHQVLEESGKVPEGAMVADTIATGYTYQGRVVRPALVQLQTAVAATAALPDAPATTTKPQDHPELSLDPNSGNPA
jgi:molecular chaperone GrpE (heat shock protein)